MQHSLDAGFFDHLTKPFDVEQLRRCLESLRSGQPSQLSRLAADPPAARKPV
jgi:DNA-binding response OmpR family regulator